MFERYDPSNDGKVKALFQFSFCPVAPRSKGVSPKEKGAASMIDGRLS